MKWMRPNRIGGETKTHYHLPADANDANQDMHYLRTMCRKELKTIYGNWDIKEDPPIDKRCPECTASWKKKMTLKK
jgi:hypothetical protein